MSYKYEIKKLPNSEVEIVCSVSSEEIDDARFQTIKKFQETISIDGFRKGNTPEKIILERVGDTVILEESADIVLKKYYPEILKDTKLDTIGRPSISITKLAFGNPLEFNIKIAIIPNFELPDYRTISSKQNKKDAIIKPEATDKEVEEVLLQMRKNKAHFDFHKNNPQHKDHEHPDIENEENLPALDDKFATETGNFKSVSELREKIKENIILEKKNREVEKVRAQMLDALVEATEIALPEILIASETEKSLAQMKDDIARINGKWEEYLSHIKKGEDDLRKDLRENSKKKAKIQLIFNKIAEKEGLEPDKTILEEEVSHLKEHYKDADENNIRIYVSTMLLNQKVLNLLEKQ